MKRILLACAVAGPLIATVQTNPVTYYRDVVPILQKHCLSCHRPGQIAPISFTSYAQTRRWADGIRHVIVTHRMPAWSGAPRGEGKHFLAAEEANTLLRWVDEGQLEGDPKDAPPDFMEETTCSQYRDNQRAY